MLHRLCDGLAGLIRNVVWIAFAAMIVTIGLQIVSRNLLDTQIIWTSDVALLLFTWLIFVGSALGLRTGSHYFVDMLPTHIPVVRLVVEIISIIAGFCVVWILSVDGWTLASLRASGEVQSIGISRFWMYLPLPISGVLMAVFLIEMTVNLMRNPFGKAPA